MDDALSLSGWISVSGSSVSFRESKVMEGPVAGETWTGKGGADTGGMREGDDVDARTTWT